MKSTTSQPVSNAPGDDSRVSDPAVPVWLFIVLFLLLYWGAVYFDEHGGWFSSQVYAPYRSAEEVASFNVGGGPNPYEQGRVIYAKTCFVCHGPAGLGAPGTFPPLAGSDWVNEQQPGRVIRLVLQGLQGPGLKINGQPFNTGSSMVPWNSMSDEDVAAVITYVRGNKEWNNHAAPVTPEQVKAIRDKVSKSHPLAYSPEELEKISPAE